ncbi:MAG: SDR family NAD(P)-dependent oxidoreductase, partial [Propioniciclava sp.]
MSEKQRLTGQRVLVIGGARDLGLAVGTAVAEAGATVIVAARDPERARSAAAGIPGASAVGLDITDEASTTRALDAVGHVDHIVATASAHHNVPVTEYTR